MSVIPEPSFKKLEPTNAREDPLNGYIYGIGIAV